MQRVNNPLEKEYGQRGTAQETQAQTSPLSTLFLDQNVTELLKELGGFAQFAARYKYPVDEYRAQTLAPDIETSILVQPTYEFDELIESVLITGPPTQGSSTELNGTATGPAANANVVNLGALPKGQYLVNWSVGLSAGAPVAADADNMKLTLGSLVENASYPAALQQTPQEPVYITADGAAILSVKSIALATAGVVYAAQVNVVPVPPAFTLQLGNRVWNLVLPPTGVLVIAPVNISLARQDIRQLTSTLPGDWSVELTGWGDVKPRRG